MLLCYARDLCLGTQRAVGTYCRLVLTAASTECNTVSCGVVGNVSREARMNKRCYSLNSVSILISLDHIIYEVDIIHTVIPSSQESSVRGLGTNI